MVDIVGLHPNIPHKEGLSALRKQLDNRMKKYISSATLCDLAEVVLKNNIFKSGKKNIKAKKTDYNWNEISTSLWYSVYGGTEFKPYLWWRYIDDIFFLWQHGEEKLKSFIDNINKMHPTIKVTADWPKTSMNFSDLTVFIAEGVIETDLFVKSTDSHQYLLSSSCHPFYYKKVIPYRQALRLNRVCSNNEIFG